jgi:hypothetical protein
MVSCGSYRDRYGNHSNEATRPNCFIEKDSYAAAQPRLLLEMRANSLARRYPSILFLFLIMMVSQHTYNYPQYHRNSL